MNHSLDSLHEQFCVNAELIRNLRPSTIRWYQRVFRQFRGFYADQVKTLGDITNARLRAYFVQMRQTGWKASNFLNQYKALKSFLKWCVQNGYLEQNPIQGIEKPKLEKSLPKRISKDDAKRVLEFAFHRNTRCHFQRYRDRAVLGLMIYAGLRAQEVLDLKMGHLDLERRSLFIESGKGAKDRFVPVSSTLSRYLREYLEDRARLKKDSIYVFTTLQGNGCFTYRGLHRLVRMLRSATGIDFTPHRLRHTFATLMLEGGCDLFSLQKMLGHSHIQTTTIYLSASAQMLQAQIAKHPLE